MGGLLDYRERPPVPALRRFVQSFWELDAPCDVAAPQLIVPDGCVSLVLNFGGTMERVDTAAPQRQARTLLMGEVRRPVSLQSHHRLDLLGIRFWPGAVRWFLDTTVAEIVDVLSDEAPLHRALARSIRDAVFQAHPADRLRLLQAALLRRVSEVSAGHDLVDAVVRTLVAHDGCVPIETVAATLDVGRRAIERRFARDVGMAPKSLAGVLRFRRVLRFIEHGAADWAAVAADCGYYDQSHMIRDFKRFTGMTPEVYRIDQERLRAETSAPDAFVQYARTGSG